MGILFAVVSGLFVGEAVALKLFYPSKPKYIVAENECEIFVPTGEIKCSEK